MYLHDPRKTLIVVEDSAVHYKVFMHPDKLIENIFDELQKITNDNFMKNKWKLQLKFVCAKFGTEEINEKLPISSLPFPWLVLRKKNADTKQH